MKYRIREKSVAWYALKLQKPLAVVGLACACYMAFAAAEIAFAEETEQPEEIPSVPEVEFVEPEPVKLWDVPLSEELQFHIVEVANAYGVEPELILAVIGQESNYNPDVVGDNGDSLGLMQIQPKWHLERMGDLGCFDLMNPYDNVIVGTDILAEKLDKYGNVEDALMVYNAGDSGAQKLYFSKGIVSDYAKEVVERYEELKTGVIQYGE